MTRRKVYLAVVVAVLAGNATGYLIGFRHGWHLGLVADQPARGALSLGLMHRLEDGHVDDIKASLEAEIDSALIHWPEVEDSRVFFALNTLSGAQVLPEAVTYLRQIAAYRREQASPNARAETVRTVLDSVRTSDPTLAQEMSARATEDEQLMARVVEKYGNQDRADECESCEKSSPGN